MTRITILYPNNGGQFDMEYYVRQHMPESIARLSAGKGFKSVSVERGVGGEGPGVPAAFIAICHYEFESAEDFIAAFMPHAEFLQGDMPNYTDIKPIIQFNEIEIQNSPDREKNFLSLSIDRFEQLRDLGTKTFKQLDEQAIHWSPDPESNSIAIIVQHLYGNMISRFTDFLTTDGEKPDRNRDEEFIEHNISLEELTKRWELGWECVFSAIGPLTIADMNKEVFIRGESHTVMEAILRSIGHFAYHVGQIVYIGKHLRSSEWKTLSIPRKA